VKQGNPHLDSADHDDDDDEAGSRQSGDIQYACMFVRTHCKLNIESVDLARYFYDRAVLVMHLNAVIERHAMEVFC